MVRQSKNKVMRRSIWLIAMLCGCWLAAHAQTPAAGTVHASVPVAADASNSYALYLPSNYSTAKHWPLLLIFDPSARGEVPVKLFHEAAERYGFILIGSNNSRNFEDPSNAIRLLAAEVKDRYAADPRRLYAAGLSGGARVASSIALACKGCIAGVIANGAGLPQRAAIADAENIEWFLVAGTTDFNYPELWHLKENLDARGAASRFVVYDGPHTWMPAEFAERALAWLQLRAMVKGIATLDRDFINKQFDSRLAEAQAAQKSGDILTAVRAYRDMASDLKTLRDVKELEAAAKSLAESEDFRKAKKSEKAALELQDEIANKIGNLVAMLNQPPDARVAIIEQVQSAVHDAYRRQKDASNAAQKEAIARGLASAFSLAAGNGEKAMLKKDYSSAKDMFQAAEIIQPESPWASYLMATANAQLGEKKQALQELNKALDRGMTNRKLLDDAAFDRIRNEEGFKEVAAKLSQAASH